MKQDLRFVSVAQEILPDGGYRAVTHIPVAVIEKTDPLRVERKEKS